MIGLPYKCVPHFVSDELDFSQHADLIPQHHDINNGICVTMANSSRHALNQEGLSVATILLSFDCAIPARSACRD